MIDDSDGDFTLLLGSSTPGALGFVFLLLALVFYYVSCENKKECSRKHCDVGAPVLANHECVCQTKAQ